MKFNTAIQDMVCGDTVEGFYILSEANVKTSRDGRPFLAAKLTDRTGSIDAKMWDYNLSVGAADAGKIIKVRGNVSEYRGSLQFTIELLRLKEDADQVDIAALAPMAPIDISAAFSEVETLIKTIGDADYRTVCETMLARHRDFFLSSPAALRVHHAFISGLLMHTANMMKIADFTGRLYADFVDRDLLLAGTFLHDFGKRLEFLYSELGLVVDYSVKGTLIGHLVLGAMEVAEIAREIGIADEKSTLLQHLILSHHGEPDYGAAVKPACVEAELLSQIDMMDSTIETYRELLANTEENSFSEKSYFLGNRKIFNHS